jgi:AraC-like DNA-binding protein
MIEYEIVTHDRIRGVRVLVNTIRIRSIHMHHDAELLYAISGSGTIIIKNQPHPMKTGDVLLINAYESHEILSEQDGFTLVIIQFSSHFLQDYGSLRNILFLDSELRTVMKETDYHTLCRHIEQLSLAYLEGGDYFHLPVISHLSEILYLILNRTHIELLSETEYSKRRKNEKRMKRVSEYIETNYQDQIRLSDIAEQENLTVTHLSHLISEQFGVSFQDYLKHKRLENAVRLIHTGRTLSEISEYCGFSELKYMTKAFKETFHMTPAEYRKKEEQIPSVSSLEDRSEYIYSDREALVLLRQSFGDN